MIHKGLLCCGIGSRRSTRCVIGVILLMPQVAVVGLAGEVRAPASASARRSPLTMPASEIAAEVSALLRTDEPRAVDRALALARLGARQAAGKGITDSLLAYFHSTTSVDSKYAVVDTLTRISGQDSHAFFAGLLSTKEPVSARIKALQYLAGNMRLLRHDVEPAMQTLLEGLSQGTEKSSARRPPDGAEAWIALQDLIQIYRLPPLPSDTPPDRRLNDARQWWSGERTRILSMVPKGPRLLALGGPTPHRVYDWDEGLTLISRLIDSPDQASVCRGAALVTEARLQLRGTGLARKLELAASRLSQDFTPRSLNTRRLIIIALMAIDDPESHAWFVKQLKGGMELPLRVVCAQYLSLHLRPGEAEKVFEVALEAVRVPDGDTLHGQPRLLEDLRRVVDRVLANLATGLNVTATSVDWHRPAEERAAALDRWWKARETSPR